MRASVLCILRFELITEFRSTADKTDEADGFRIKPGMTGTTLQKKKPRLKGRKVIIKYTVTLIIPFIFTHLLLI